MPTQDTKTAISSSEWMEIFEKEIWSKLTRRQQHKLYKRFDIHSTNNNFRLLSSFSAQALLPFAFVVAALHKAKSDRYDLLHTIQDKKQWIEKITYDQDKWGPLRQHTTFYGILKQSFIDKPTAHHFEQLLKSSISLDMNDKLKVIGASATLSKFQITELIKVWEKEMKRWHELFLEQRTNIKKLIKKTEQEWQRIEKNIAYFLDTDSEEIVFDAEHHLIPKSIKFIMEKSIKGQTEAITKIATILYYHNKIHAANTNKKSKLPFPPIDPVLISGATGSGKSLILQTGCDLMGIPYLHVDSSSLVSAGIRGYTVSDILKDLLRKTHYKRRYAESAVILFDEIDKLLAHHDGISILYQLLRLVEGTEISIDKTQDEMVEFRAINTISTKNILFIFAGSFQHLIDQKSKQSGFITNALDKDTLQQPDIEKTTLPKELLGRIGEIILLKRLSKENFRSILLDSDHSPLKKYQKMLQKNGVSLYLSAKDIEEIVDKASKSPYGARALNQILKPYVNDLLFEIPGKQ